MIKAMAVIRTVYLAFIIGYTARAMPFFTSVARTFDEQYARCSNAVNLLTRAAWFAVGWIALETLVGWWMATRKPKLHEAGVPKPGGEPPFAPPPHR